MTTLPDRRWSTESWKCIDCHCYTITQSCTSRRHWMEEWPLKICLHGLWNQLNEFSKPCIALVIILHKCCTQSWKLSISWKACRFVENINNLRPILKNPIVLYSQRYGFFLFPRNSLFFWIFRQKSSEWVKSPVFFFRGPEKKPSFFKWVSEWN